MKRREFLRNTGQVFTDRKNLTVFQYLLGLGLVVAAAALVRFYQAGQRGLWYWDEGIFIMGARFIRWKIRVFCMEFSRVFPSPVLIPDAEMYQGFPVFLQKPAHVLMLALFSVLHKNEVLAAVYYSIVSGLVSIVATAELARKWFSPATGLLAAVFLAFMPSHVHYSRLALHETDSMAVFLILLLLIQILHRMPAGRGNVRLPAFATGFLAVWVTGMSYRYLPYVFLAAVMEFCRSRQKQPAAKIPGKWFWIVAGGIVCFVLLNISYRLAFYPDFLWSEPASYISVLKTKFLSSESSFDLEHPFFYLKILTGFDGLLPTISWLIPLPLMVFQPSRQRIQTAAFVLIPLLLFSLTTTRVPRSITGIYPFAAITWGWCMLWIWSHVKRMRSQRFAGMLFAAIISVTIVTMCLRLPPIWSVRSGYKDAVNWLEKTEDSRHFSTMYPIYAVYQGNHAVRPVPEHLEDLHREVEQTGIRYLTVDWQKYLRYRKSVYEIERHVLPVAAVKHAPGEFLLSLYENHLPGDVPELREDPTLQFIKIYDLYAVLPEMGYPVSGGGNEDE
jgi:4-amino-4-deoxy-L-arabinose transferase-like glycosyltransferase